MHDAAGKLLAALAPRMEQAQVTHGWDILIAILEKSAPRRFHNLHDAAAWIQQNWPDFDLETNHPVTWRSQK
jgi:hypothetical protein